LIYGALLQARDDRGHKQEWIISRKNINKTHLLAEGQGGVDVLQQKGDADFTMTQPAKKT
jgi:hypothetical protein